MKLDLLTLGFTCGARQLKSPGDFTDARAVPLLRTLWDGAGISKQAKDFINKDCKGLRVCYDFWLCQFTKFRRDWEMPSKY